jgi:large subunit ribosomal protein L30
MKLKVTLVKSPISSIPNHIKVVTALGLRKLHQEKIHYDSPTIRGMLFKVKHLVRVEEIAD